MDSNADQPTGERHGIGHFDDAHPGAYTAIVSGVANTTGVGLSEVYNLGLPP